MIALGPQGRGRAGRRAGQTMVFMVVALVLIALLAIWQFDVHKIISVKWRIQNAGDAGALAAARWQGQTLNLMGDLTLMQAAALSLGNTNAASDIADLQARLCYVGPMVGFQAAQQAAKNNGVYVHAGFTARLRRHADDVRSDYAQVFTEAYPGCWADYADMLEAVAAEGLAAAPDNARLYSDYSGGHMLLNPSFYDAVAGRDWCWFKWNALALLSDYVSFQDWPDLPPIGLTDTTDNSEFFGLGLNRVTTRLAAISGGQDLVALMNNMVAATSRPHLAIGVISAEVATVTADWFVYGQAWSAWSSISPEGDEPFPAIGPPQPQYDYAGADAAVRIAAAVTRVAPGEAGHTVTWTAAAKPFGYLSDSDGAPVRPDSAGLVLPAFREVRLIPVDASSAPAGGAYDLDWRDHIELHLPLYMAGGPAGIEPACWFCQQLVTWEDPLFRTAGLEWLNLVDDEGRIVHTCVSGGGGPSRPGGGRRRGH
jgi:hypothetical protein